MKLDELKKYLQRHFTDGLVTIVGSGLSAAAGLPTMKELAEHLLREMSGLDKAIIKDLWKPIQVKLESKVRLEHALEAVDADSEVLDPIIEFTADLIAREEQKVLIEALQRKRTLPLAGLLPHLIFTSDNSFIVTTNYDRLIEVAAEMAGYGTDTGFTGSYFGDFNPKGSKETLIQLIHSSLSGKSLRKRYRKHLTVCKPHGSLDWYHIGGEAKRCFINPGAPRLMITPGKHKYRMGYDAPFDHHRTRLMTRLTGLQGI